MRPAPSGALVPPAAKIPSIASVAPAPARSPWLVALLERTARDADEARFEKFLAAWVSEIPPTEIPAALAGLRDLPAAFATDASARLLRRWTSDDAPSAVAWAEQLAPGPGSDLARAVVANEITRVSPVEALRLAADLPPTPANDELIRRAAMDWSLTDQPGALAWARQISDEPFRAQVLGGIAIAWAERDPAAAGTFAAQELPAGRAQADAVVGIAQRWAEQTPADAAAWVDAFPNGSLKAAAVASVAAIWARSDAVAAAKWRANPLAQGALDPHAK